MTTRVVAGKPEMDAGQAAAIMGLEQVRRLPVLENGRLCGMVSLGDLAGNLQVGETLTKISDNLSRR